MAKNKNKIVLNGQKNKVAKMYDKQNFCNFKNQNLEIENFISKLHLYSSSKGVT